ncbi:anillin-like isoform X2 [Corticium candelabrum]|uniref:anillin-like isoform X2 n=1 Tax=Corticium candelabrum TaxID=121492 RepID=UPI002E25D257|nr:anillin-like isoform X2 [Corticium candelabrum]
MNTMDPVTQKLLAKTAQRRAATAARKRYGSESPVLRALAKFEPKRRCFEDAAEVEKENVATLEYAGDSAGKGDKICANRNVVGSSYDDPRLDAKTVYSHAHRNRCNSNEGVVTDTPEVIEATKRAVTPEPEAAAVCARQISELTEAMKRVRRSTSETNISEDRDTGLSHSEYTSSASTGYAAAESLSSSVDVTSDTSSLASNDTESSDSDNMVFSSRTIPRSKSITMMLQNSATRARCKNEVIKLLLQECLVQQDIERQASRAIEHCVNTGELSGVTEQLEAERLLRIACERRHGCLAKVEELRINEASSCSNKALFQLPPCTADITLYDIQLPLNPEFLSKLKNKPDRHCHSFFCLIRLDDISVTGTHLISTNSPEQSYQGGLKFTNKVVLHGASPNFKVVLEIYGMQTCMSNQEFKALHGASTKMKKLQSILSSARLNSPVLKKKFQGLAVQGQCQSQPNVASNEHGLSSELIGVRESRFVCLGRVELSSSNCRMTTFQLSDLQGDALLGPVHLNFSVEIHCNLQQKGFLTLYDGLLWHRRWAKLQDGVIQCWNDPEDVDKQDPTDVICLKHLEGGIASLATRDECARQHVFVLSSNSDRKLLAADSKEDCFQWISLMTELLDGLAVWSPLVSTNWSVYT